MTYLLDRDQEIRLEQEAAVEEIYISGIGDALDARMPQMAELIYLQGYVEGMRQFRKKVRTEVMLPIINTSPKEFPLLCGQCQYLDNRVCSIKSIVRDQSNFACDRVVIDSPF